MSFHVDIWLRGENHATTAAVPSIVGEPRTWSDADVATVLTGMLRAIHQAKHPDAPQDRPISLRGFSWIVNPYDDGGVVIALEMTLGAVVAGPFDASEGELTAKIARVIAAARPAASESIH